MNENTTIIDYIIQHCNESMGIALSAERILPPLSFYFFTAILFNPKTPL
jgi:hypothetical protein